MIKKYKSSSYSGFATIYYEIERFEKNIELEVYGKAYYVPEQTSANPDNAYPAEGEVEILFATHDGKDYLYSLTDDEKSDIESKLDAAVRGDVGED